MYHISSFCYTARIVCVRGETQSILTTNTFDLFLQESQRRGFCSQHLSLKAKPGQSEEISPGSSSGKWHLSSTAPAFP